MTKKEFLENKLKEKGIVSLIMIKRRIKNLQKLSKEKNPLSKVKLDSYYYHFFLKVLNDYEGEN